MANFGTWLFTMFKGELVGEDEFGNRYYRERGKTHDRWERRWVIYKGEDEASKVPPLWHQWLHKTTHTPPSELSVEKQPWQKPHHQNLTGTSAAYRPPGSQLKGGRRAAAAGDYEPWQPN